MQTGALRRESNAGETPVPLSHLQGLEVDVDLRASQVWAEIEPVVRTNELTLGVLAAALRVAYAQGYADCLADEGVELYTDHGYRDPRGTVVPSR
jgi:hypothetical protein